MKKHSYYYKQYKEASLWKVLSIKSTNLSLIRLWGKVVYNVEKSYVDKVDAQKPRDFSLFNTSHDFLIYQNRNSSNIYFNLYSILNDKKTQSKNHLGSYYGGGNIAGLYTHEHDNM